MRLLTVAFVILTLACGAKPSDAERARKGIASWDASLALTAQSWAAGHLPKHFVRNATEAAVEGLAKEAGGRIPPPLVHASARAVALAHRLDDAAGRGDRAAASRLAGELDAAAKELR